MPTSVYFLSPGGFPDNKTANINKLRFTTSAISETGVKVFVLSSLTSESTGDLSWNVLGDTNYRAFSRNIGSGALGKGLSHMIGELKRLLFLFAITPGQGKKVLVLSFIPVWKFFCYWLLARSRGFKLVLSIMEYHPSVARTLSQKINARFFDHYSYPFVDGVIPISHFLEKLARQRSKNIRTLILPILADYNLAESNPEKSLTAYGNYFLLCAAAGYKETIHFAVRSFSQLNRKDVKLVLIISGSIERVKQYSRDFKNNDQIAILSNIDYSELLNLYAYALGLLIPIRPDYQDKARFPQKIAEYLSSGRPIVTNSYGEIPYYFQNKANAYIANDYNETEFASIMEQILDNPFEATEIGKAGRELGKFKFHYQMYSDSLSTFFSTL